MSVDTPSLVPILVRIVDPLNEALGAQTEEEKKKQKIL